MHLNLLSWLREHSRELQRKHCVPDSSFHVCLQEVVLWLENYFFEYVLAMFAKCLKETITPMTFIEYGKLWMHFCYLYTETGLYSHITWFLYCYGLKLVMYLLNYEVNLVLLAFFLTYQKFYMDFHKTG